MWPWKKKELKEIDPEAVDLVNAPANEREFIVIKNINPKGGENMGVDDNATAKDETTDKDKETVEKANKLPKLKEIKDDLMKAIKDRDEKTMDKLAKRLSDSVDRLNFAYETEPKPEPDKEKVEKEKKEADEDKDKTDVLKSVTEVIARAVKPLQERIETLEKRRGVSDRMMGQGDDDDEDAVLKNAKYPTLVAAMRLIASQHGN